MTRRERLAHPLDDVPSIKLKLGFVIAAAVAVTVFVFWVLIKIGVWPSVSGIIAAAIAMGMVWFLSRGMTSPLRQMAAAASEMAKGMTTTRWVFASTRVSGAPVRSTPEAALELITWVTRFQARIPAIISICTGAFVLGAAGLLDGRRATTHWLYLNELRARFPKAKVVDTGIFTRDGRIWTSAGVTAGIDLTLALVERDHGHEVAMTVAKRLVLFFRRSGNQAQFSDASQRMEQAPTGLRNVESFSPSGATLARRSSVRM